MLKELASTDLKTMGEKATILFKPGCGGTKNAPQKKLLSEKNNEQQDHATTHPHSVGWFVLHSLHLQNTKEIYQNKPPT